MDPLLTDPSDIFSARPQSLGPPLLIKLKVKPVGILTGIAEIEDEWLGLDKGARLKSGGYSKGAAIRLLSCWRQPNGELAARAFREIIHRLQQNLEALQPVERSRQNWRWQQQLHLKTHNDGEKRLERCWAFLTNLDAWANHVPVCSFSTLREGGRAIDLVHERCAGVLEFIELKYGRSSVKPGSNHPLYAAIELLEYGLIFLWSKCSNFLRAGKFLSATAVELIVLAPMSFYRVSRIDPTALKSLADEISLGLNIVCDQLFSNENFSMSFRFETFAEEFQTYYQSLKSAMQDFPEKIEEYRISIYDNEEI